MPITETTTATGSGSVGIAGLSVVTAAATTGQVDIAVLLGAFAGSVVFVMSATEYHWLIRIVYLLVSTIIGYQSAPLTAGWLSVELVVAAIINGVLAIIVLNGLIIEAKSGNKILQAIFSLLSSKK